MMRGKMSYGKKKKRKSAKKMRVKGYTMPAKRTKRHRVSSYMRKK